MPYEVQLAVFQGPLHLLLHLIERDQMEITSVSVAQIADQYLAHLARMQERDVSDLADFVVMAARLLWIKSRALLPRPPQPLAETAEEDPAEVLARQLREYKRIREAADWLQERSSKGLRSYVRIAAPPLLPPTLQAGQVTVDDLIQALTRALAETPPADPVGTLVVSAIATIAEQIGLILEATRKGSVGFRSLLSRAVTRTEIIVTLLAVLELVKQGEIRMAQERMFGDIVISQASRIDWTPPMPAGAP